MKNPQKDYPKALFISVVVIIFTLILGSLAIAIVVPKEKISLVAGLMQALEVFLDAFHLRSIFIISGTLILIGIIGNVSNWIIGPTKGLMFALKDLQVSEFLTRENNAGAPATILIVQAALCSALCLVFFFMPSINSSYWLLTVLASQLYLCMYIMLFVGAFYLRLKKSHVKRAYTVPGKLAGLALICMLGILSSAITFVIGFYPPESMLIENTLYYRVAILVGFLILSSPAYWLYRYSTKSKQTVELSEMNAE